MFSSADLSLAAEKMRENYFVTGGFFLQNHRRLPASISIVNIAVFGSLKRVTGRIFKIGK
jgi:hypothetical protein